MHFIVFLATEKEIYNGILKLENPNKSALCFIRDIENIEEHLSDRKAERFIDLKTDHKTGQKILDTEAKQLLNELKEKKIPDKLNKDTNIFYYKVKWANNGIDADSLQPYLKSFGEKFYFEIIRLLDNSMNSDNLYNSLDCDTFVSNSYGLKAADRFRMIKDKINNKQNEIRTTITDFKLKEISNELKLLIKGKIQIFYLNYSKLKLKFISEMASHLHQYKEITGKFFGRDDLMKKVGFCVFFVNAILSSA